MSRKADVKRRDMLNVLKLAVPAAVLILAFQNCADVKFSKDDGAGGSSAQSSATGTPGSGADGSGGTTGTGADGSGGSTTGTGADGSGGTGTGTGTGSDGSGTTCSIGSTTIPTKVLFLVDTTGSNSYTSRVNFSDGTFIDVPPTDLNKSFRAGSLQAFFDKYKAKTTLQWGLVTFAQTGTNYAHSMINISGNDQNPKFGSAAEMQSAINAFKSVQDNGLTPYYPAMNMAQKIIKNDPDLNAASKPRYIVVLLTDGMPTDKYNSQDVTLLTGIAPGRITVSTIFYSPQSDAFASQFLQAIATTGGGQFIANIANTGPAIIIDDVIPTQVCK